MDNAVVLLLVLGLIAIVGIVVTPAITGAAWLKEVKSSILQPSIFKENVKKAVKEADVEKTVEGFHKIIGYCVCSYEGHKYTCELNPYCSYGISKAVAGEITEKKALEKVTGGAEKIAPEPIPIEVKVPYTCNCKTPVSTLAGRDVCQMTPGCYFESAKPMPELLPAPEAKIPAEKKLE